MTARVTTGSQTSGEDRERHGVVHDPRHLELPASAVLLAKDIADYLERSYGGWLWAVGVDPKGGVVTIRSMRLSGEWGYQLKLDWVQHDPKVRRRLVLRAAGEILERFRMRAGPYRHEYHAHIPRDVSGAPKPDLSDKPGKVRRRARDEALTAAVKNGAVEIRYADRQLRDGRHYREILIASGKPPDVRS